MISEYLKVSILSSAVLETGMCSTAVTFPAILKNRSEMLGKYMNLPFFFFLSTLWSRASRECALLHHSSRAWQFPFSRGMADPWLNSHVAKPAPEWDWQLDSSSDCRGQFRWYLWNSLGSQHIAQGNLLCTLRYWIHGDCSWDCPTDPSQTQSLKIKLVLMMNKYGNKSFRAIL